MENQTDIRRKELMIALSRSKTSGDFMKQALPILQNYSPNFSFGSFASRAGFSSRSFVRSLFVGERRLTLNALDKVIKALRLGDRESKLLELLIKRESGEVVSERDIIAALQALEKSINAPTLNQVASEIYQMDHWPYVFSSLYSTRGQTASQIVERSTIPLEECIKILQKLCENDLVRFEEESNTYFLNNAYIDLEANGRADFFQRFFTQTHHKAGHSADKHYTDSHHMFFGSVMMVKRSDMPKLTKEFQAIIAKYCESIEDEQGDELAVLNTSFFPLKN